MSPPPIAGRLAPPTAGAIARRSLLREHPNRVKNVRISRLNQRRFLDPSAKGVGRQPFPSGATLCTPWRMQSSGAGAEHALGERSAGQSRVARRILGAVAPGSQTGDPDRNAPLKSAIEGCTQAQAQTGSRAFTLERKLADPIDPARPKYAGQCLSHNTTQATRRR